MNNKETFQETTGEKIKRKWTRPMLILLLLSVLGRGIIGSSLFEESPLYAYTYLLRVYVPVFIIGLVIKLVSRGNKEIQSKIWLVIGILLGACIIVMILLMLLLILNSHFHFWF